MILFIVIGIPILLFLIGTSIYVLDPDKMLLIVQMGSYDRVIVPEDDVKELREAGKVIPTTMHTAHLWDTTVLLWPFWRGVYLPRTSVILQYHGTQIWTKNNISIRLTATITFNLGTDLQAFIKTFNVFGRGRDLAREENIGYVFAQNPDTGETTTLYYKGPCLGQIIVEQTNALVQDVFRHVAGKQTFNQIKNDMDKFEGLLRYHLAEPRSRFARAKILQRDGRITDASTGTAVELDTFDINVTNIMVEDQNNKDALSAPERGRLEGEGEGKRLKQIATKSGLEPQEIIRNETLRKMENVTIVSAPDSLQAQLERLLGIKKGKK